jgi:hypothetical protein
MIDYARSFRFDELPDYQLLRSQIQETRRRAGAHDFYPVEWHIPPKTLGLFNYALPAVEFPSTFPCR